MIVHLMVMRFTLHNINIDIFWFVVKYDQDISLWDSPYYVRTQFSHSGLISNTS